MDEIRRNKLLKLYGDWSAEQSDTPANVRKALDEYNTVLEKHTGKVLTKSNLIELDDASNDYAISCELEGFIAGFDTAVKLLIGGGING